MPHPELATSISSPMTDTTQQAPNQAFDESTESATSATVSRHVAYAFDQGYVNVSLLSIASLAAYQEEGQSTVIHLVTDGELPSESIQRFEAIAKRHPGIELRWYPITEQRAAKFAAGWRWPRATYFRLLLPELLESQTDRVIYIDGDTLVLGDLGGFWEIEMGEHIVAGCVDATWPNCKLRKEQFDRHQREVPAVWKAVPDDYPYMNGGVLLLNLAEWRRTKLTERCYQMMEVHPESCEIVDQDLLTVLQIPRLVIDPKWNIQAGALGWYGYHKTARTYESSMGRSFEALMQEPGILHFCGDCPWDGLSISRLKSRNVVEQKYLQELWRSRLKSTPAYSAHVARLLGKGLVRDLKAMRHRLRKRYQEAGS